jgi:hypothetical protein
MTVAETQLNPRDGRTDVREADWSTLFGRALDDITHIVQSEARLLTAGMRTVLEAQLDRIFAFLAIGGLIAAGAVCLLGAAILLLHEYAMLPLWQSFGIVGLSLFAIAILVGAFVSCHPESYASF